jgi:transposase
MIFVGIDVAKNKHDCCILGEEGEILSSFTFPNNCEGFDKLMSEIKRFSENSDIKIGLESTGHYSTNIANFLTQKHLSVRIFNPLQVSLLRKASTLRKTKTDKSDAYFLATLLFPERTKSYTSSVWSHSELKIHVRNRFRLISIRTTLKISISRLITILFPEFPDVVYSVNQKSSYALLSEFSTAKEIANANIVKLTNILSKSSHGKYGREKAEQIRNLARKSIGLDSPATGFELRQTIRLIQNIQEEIDFVEAEIKKIMNQEGKIIMSIPGIGYILGAIILAEYGDFSRFQTPSQMLKYAGLEPAVYESGNFKSTKTSMVKRGSKYLRWALLQAARLVAYRDETFAEYEHKKRLEGKHFYVIQSHIAKKLVRVIFALMKNNSAYLPNKTPIST